MRRRMLPVVAAALAILVVGLPVEAGAGSYTWTAGLGSHDGYGTIKIAAPYSGGGMATVTLRNLVASATYSIEIYAGTCSRKGARLFRLKVQKAALDGKVTVMLRLSTVSMDRVRTATWGRGHMSAWVTRGTWRTCGVFAGPANPWGTPTPAPTATPTQTPGPVAAGTIDWDLAHCPTAAEIASVNADLTITFLADPTAGTLVCTAAAGSAELTRFQERLYQAILSMKRIHFDAPLPWTSQPLYSWFVGAIDGIIVENTGENNSCCSPPRYIHIQAVPNHVALTTNRWIKPSLSEGGGLLYFVQLLLHEARHSEGPGHTCGIGDDNTISEMGAWAIVYYYYTWLGLHGDPIYLAPPSDAPSLAGYGPADYYRQTELNMAQSTKNTRFCLEPH